MVFDVRVANRLVSDKHMDFFWPNSPLFSGIFEKLWKTYKKFVENMFQKDLFKYVSIKDWQLNCKSILWPFLILDCS